MDVGRMSGSIRNNRGGKIEDYVVEVKTKLGVGVKKLTAESKWPKPQIDWFSKILKGIQGWIEVLLKQPVKDILEIPSFFCSTYIHVHKGSTQFNNEEITKETDRFILFRFKWLCYEWQVQISILVYVG